jgi:hypothetical protein
MKTNKLFLVLGVVLTGFLFAALSGCDNTTDPPPAGGVTYDDTAVTAFSGTLWTDGLLPESTIDFTSPTSVDLTGKYFEQHNGPTGLTTLAGTRTYQAVSNLSAVAVEPAVQVYVSQTADYSIGFQLYYYQADTATGKHQRLVVYCAGLQPREFYKL